MLNVGGFLGQRQYGQAHQRVPAVMLENAFLTFHEGVVAGAARSAVSNECTRFKEHFSNAEILDQLE